MQPAHTGHGGRSVRGVSKIVLDLHGARARKGVDVDALENFFEHFRSALREWSRANEGTIARKGGRPYAREAATAAFRLIEFRTGSGIATLAPSLPPSDADDDLTLDDGDETLAVRTLRSLMQAIEHETPLPDPVVESLSNARRSIGDDGSFGVDFAADPKMQRVVVDERRIERLRQPTPDATDTTISVTGRLHLIEADLPNRRVGIRAPDGTDWTCTYPDDLHPVVTKLVERLVRIRGIGRRTTQQTGRLRIDWLEEVVEHEQDALFTIEPVPVEQLRAEQHIAGPQSLAGLVDDEWQDDEQGRRYLEAVLGDVL